jgi:hypothetical protein
MSVLTDWNHLGKLHFGPPKALSSQKTHNTKVVANFLHFRFTIHTLKSDKQGRIYDRWNTVHKWKNHGYSF